MTDVTLTYRDLKGSNLTAAEGDANMRAIVARLPGREYVVTATGQLTKANHAFKDGIVDSASPVTLTLQSTGLQVGDEFSGVNIGAGALTLAGGTNVTIVKHAALPDTVAQHEPWLLKVVKIVDSAVTVVRL